MTAGIIYYNNYEFVIFPKSEIITIYKRLGLKRDNSVPSRTIKKLPKGRTWNDISEILSGGDNLDEKVELAKEFYGVYIKKKR